MANLKMKIFLGVTSFILLDTLTCLSLELALFIRVKFLSDPNNLVVRLY